MNVVDPRGLDARDWIDSTLDLLSDFFLPMKIESGEEWREWGNYVRQTLRVRGILIPAPDSYLDWEEWAMRFNQVLAPVRS